MKAKVFSSFVLCLAVLACTVAAGSLWADHDDRHDDHDQEAAPLRLLGTIAIPGNPIASTDIAYVDQKTGRLYFSDRSNLAVEVVDARHDLFLGRITKNAAGTLTFAGLTSPSTHEGPNGVVATDDKKVWAADGDSTVKVVDVDPTSATYMQIVASVSTAGLTSVSACTGGSTGTCNRADEIAYDPENQIIMVINDEPGGTLQPFATFVSAKAPYTVLGQSNFAAQGAVAAGGLEQPAWDPEIHRFLQTLPEVNATTGTGAIAIINPKTFAVERVISMAGFDCSPSGEALGEDQHLAVACSIRPAATAPSPSTFPLVIDVGTGTEVGSGINQVGGGDEINFNPGDNRFITSSYLDGVSTNPSLLGVIDGRSGNWLQNVPPASAPVSPATIGTGGLLTSGRPGNLAALGENNHVFVIVHPATPPATDVCGFFTAGATKTDYGCVAVFGPTHRDHDDDHGDHRWDGPIDGSR